MSKISVGLRLGTMLLDHLIICLIGIPPLIFYDLLTNSHNGSVGISPYSMIPLFVIYFCKDCVGGRSPAKRILKLAVVDYKTNTPAKPFQSLIRNLFVLIWPIEVIVSFFNQERRSGDRIAGTKLNYYTEQTGSRPQVLQIVSSVLIATTFTYFLMKLFDNF
jgi:uncharacterized RDD family membrane protein YckC